MWAARAWQGDAKSGTSHATQSVVMVELAQELSVALPPGWYQYSNEEGTPYYYNHHTKATTWERPAQMPPHENEPNPPGNTYVK